MKKHFLPLLFFIISPIILNAQLIFNNGAISTSMAGLNSTSSNVWSINNNIGQLSNMEFSSASISVFQPFLVSDFTTSSIAVGLLSKNGGFGISYSNYGNEFLQFHSTGLGYSMSLNDQFSGGIKINYHYINAGNIYLNKSAISADLGIGAQLNEELKIGVQIINPTLSELDDYDNERIPTVMQIAIGYELSDEVSAHFAVNKDIIYPASFLAAIEYKPNKSIVFRGGVGTNPSLASFGIGTSLKKFMIDIAAQYHQILGFSPEISLTYSFNN
jgi:hypothetical protein